LTAAIPRLRLWREESFWWRWLYPSFPEMGARAFGLARHLSAFHDGRKIRWDNHNMHDVHNTSLRVGDTTPYRSDAEMNCLLIRFIISLFGKAFGKDKRKESASEAEDVRIFIIPPIPFDCIYLTLCPYGILIFVIMATACWDLSLVMSAFSWDTMYDNAWQWHGMTKEKRWTPCTTTYLARMR
jgi:hypothetical protein